MMNKKYFTIIDIKKFLEEMGYQWNCECYNPFTQKFTAFTDEDLQSKKGEVCLKMLVKTRNQKDFIRLNCIVSDFEFVRIINSKRSNIGIDFGEEWQEKLIDKHGEDYARDLKNHLEESLINKANAVHGLPARKGAYKDKEDFEYYEHLFNLIVDKVYCLQDRIENINSRFNYAKNPECDRSIISKIIYEKQQEIEALELEFRETDCEVDEKEI